MQKQQLEQIIEKVEVLEREKLQVQEAITDVFGEAKNAGFDVPILKKILRMRKMKPEALEEEDMLIQTYREAIGL
jgi:uncharacterized protein (UPF0335 family)